MTTVHGYGADDRSESMTSIAEFDSPTSFVVVCSLFVGSDGPLSSVVSNLGG